MLKVADSGALQFQSFERPMYTELVEKKYTPASSTLNSLVSNMFTGFFVFRVAK